jgi:hypothetical protein
MSLAQQYRSPRTEDEPAIEDGVPAPPIELEQLMCKPPPIAQGKEHVGSRQPNAPKPAGLKVLGPRPASKAPVAPPVSNSPGEAHGNQNIVPPETAAQTSGQRVEQDAQQVPRKAPGNMTSSLQKYWYFLRRRYPEPQRW